MSGCCGSNQLGLGRPLLQPWVGGVRCFHMAQRVAPETLVFRTVCPAPTRPGSQAQHTVGAAGRTGLLGLTSFHYSKGFSLRPGAQGFGFLW